MPKKPAGPAKPGKAAAKEPFKAAEGVMLRSGVSVSSGYEELEERMFGKSEENRLELSLVEAAYLLEKAKLKVKKSGKAVGFPAFMKDAGRADARFRERFVVFRDLRDRGLVVKTGFKFGCDFRVYKRGVKARRGPKAAGEHTKWIVYAAPEDYTCAFQELSRAVRLAHSIRARMLWAVVDNESNVTYYEVLRIKP